MLTVVFKSKSVICDFKCDSVFNGTITYEACKYTDEFWKLFLSIYFTVSASLYIQFIVVKLVTNK